MWGQLFVNAEVNPVLARGRGLGRLIEGLSNGDPTSWAIAVGVVVVFGGIAIYKQFSDSDD
ncbi:MAG: hypothetical protein JWN70_1030 [Planctomycetaceae bacterium]|nr:hypothetical protein [Planctomycetaceae bacterium]